MVKWNEEERIRGDKILERCRGNYRYKVDDGNDEDYLGLESSI